MIRMNMNFLKIAAFFCLMMSAMLCWGQEEGYDHESLTTVEGKVYKNIFIVEADSFGLTFRHRDGIAKLPFSSLSESYRMLYETDDETLGTEVDFTTGAEDWAAPVGTSQGAVHVAGPENLLPTSGPSFVITWYFPRADHACGVGCCPSAHGFIPYPLRTWPQSLAVPAYREAAVRNFLIESGLIEWPSYGW